MKARGDNSLKWLPLWIDKWLFGSTRIELKPDERSVWLDLMALSAKDEGFVRANVGMPYPIKQLSGMLYLEEELLLRTIERCKSPEVKKIIEMSDKTLFLPSWNEYKLSARHMRRFDMSLKADMMAESAALIDKNREDKNREDKEENASLKDSPHKSDTPFFECEFFKIEKEYHEALQKEFPLIDFERLLKRLRDYISDNPKKYKRTARGYLKNPKSVIRNWCESEVIKSGTVLSKKETSEPAKDQCKWCKEIYFVKDDHQCKPENIRLPQ